MSEEWDEYKKFVLAELARCHKQHEKLDKKVRELEISLAKAQGKASALGAIMGAITGLLSFFLK